MKAKVITLFTWMFIGFGHSFGQVSLFAGTGTLKGFSSSGKSFYGFNAGIELPRSNDMTLYGRIGYYFPRAESQNYQTYVTAINTSTSPYNLTVNYALKTNYTTIEGGTRRYIGNDYDNGFSAYGGTNFMLIFNSVKRNYEDKDATGTYSWRDGYQTSATEPDKGNIISIALGLQGGVKYTIPATGTIFFDVNGQYALLAKANNATAQATSQYSPLIFTFTLGFRKDLY